MGALLTVTWPGPCPLHSLASLWPLCPGCRSPVRSFQCHLLRKPSLPNTVPPPSKALVISHVILGPRRPSEGKFWVGPWPLGCSATLPVTPHPWMSPPARSPLLSSPACPLPPPAQGLASYMLGLMPGVPSGVGGKISGVSVKCRFPGLPSGLGIPRVGWGVCTLGCSWCWAGTVEGAAISHTRSGTPTELKPPEDRTVWPFSAFEHLTPTNTGYLR